MPKTSEQTLSDYLLSSNGIVYTRNQSRKRNHVDVFLLVKFGTESRLAGQPAHHIMLANSLVARAIGFRNYTDGSIGPRGTIGYSVDQYLFEELTQW